MRELKTLREGWDEIARMEEQEAERLAEKMTIEQSVKDFLSLLNAFAPLIKETREIFRTDRTVYLTELQDKLRKFETWRQEQYGNTVEPA